MTAFHLTAWLALVIVAVLIFLILFEPGLAYRASAPDFPLDSHQFLGLVAAVVDAQLLGKSRVEVLTNGREFYEAELQAIRSARHSVHVEAYVFRPGHVAQLFLDALTERAKAGVTVRVVIDAIGSFPMRHKRFRELRAAGGLVCRYYPAVWPHFANMTLGVWLITSAFALAYRSTALQWSDIASGTLVIVLAALSLSSRPFWKFWAPWANSLVGVWLLFAPLVFWAPTAAAYANDTLLGALVVVLAILAPGMPMAAGMSMEPGVDVPQGWSYNPSSWPQRAPIIALALVGFFLSRQMAAFELGHITSMGDPFFGTGTESVLTSTVSRAFPIPDAGLGALAYMIEFLMGFMGDKRRWRTMPWMVTFFGILVVPLGIVSITLIILQPLAVDAWCTPCLLAAAAMIIMIALTLDEVVAMVQFLVQATREGQSFWRTFWVGGALRGMPTPGAVREDVVSVKAMLWGVALPWNLVLATAVGAWLMFTPAVLGSAGKAAHTDHLFGALVVTTTVIALADVGRAARFLNLLLGAGVIVSPWLLGGATTSSKWSDLLAGVLVMLLSLRRGPVGERYGLWQRFIR